MNGALIRGSGDKKKAYTKGERKERDKRGGRSLATKSPISEEEKEKEKGAPFETHNGAY